MTDETPKIYERIGFLRRRFPLRFHVAKGRLGIVPLADVVLLIALFLFLTSWIVLKPGVTLELPQAAFTGGAHAGAAVVAVTQEGLIFFEDERVTMRALDLRLRAAAHRMDERMLIIEADVRVPHGTVVELYNLAEQAGFKQIALATGIKRTQEPAP